MKAIDPPPPITQPRAASALRWRETLHFRLGWTFVVMLLLVLLLVFSAGRILVLRDLSADAFRAERESGLRLALQLTQFAQRAETLALSLASTTAALSGQFEDLERAGTTFVDALPSDLPFNQVGIWPEPGALFTDVQRNSLLWLREAQGYELRDDYNDPRVAPYWRERWYTPTRFLDSQRCFWSTTTKDPLAKAAALMCSLPIVKAGRYSGAVTVSLPLDTVLSQLAALTQGQPGYVLLLDAEDRILAASPALMERLPAGEVLNLASLAQRFPAYNTLALTLHERRERVLSDFNGSNLAARAPALASATRDTSLQDAQLALLSLWMGTGQAPLWEARMRFLDIEQDPVLQAPSYASTFELHQPGWRLVRIAPAQHGFAAVEVLFFRMMVVLGGASALLLLMVFWRMHALVLDPLRRMVGQMSETGSTTDTYHTLPQTELANELGLFAHWHNERVRQVRDFLDRNRSLSARLAQDASERAAIQEQIRRLQDRHALAMQALDEAVVMVDEQGRIQEINGAARRLLGKPVAVAERPRFVDVFPVRSDVLEVGGQIDLSQPALQRGQRVQYAEDLELVKDEKAVPISATSIPLRGRNDRVYGAIVVMRPRIGGAAAIAPAAATDPLTGLPPRGVCEQRLRELIENAKLADATHAALWIDVDQMTRVNDRNGLSGGNEALVRLADLLRRHTVNGGECFRIGSDKFAVLLPNATAEAAQRVAESLRRMVESTPVELAGKNTPLSVSIGIAEFGANSASASEVLLQGREACARAKEAGRNTVRLYEKSHETPAMHPDEELWATRLRAGLEQGLLRLSEQRVQALRAEEPAALELQLLLEDEEGFWTPASVFMPIAERQRLAGDLDRWALAQAIRLLATPSAGRPDPAFLALRVSTSALTDPRLPEYIAEQLNRHPDIMPARLCFLVDRQALLQHPQPAQAFAAALAALGCGLGVDCFEARSASELALLRRLRAAYARIDGASYPQIETDAVQQGLATATVNVARSLGSRVIVGNIVADAQAERWRKLDVDYLQGNAVARAIPLILASG